MLLSSKSYCIGPGGLIHFLNSKSALHRTSEINCSKVHVWQLPTPQCPYPQYLPKAQQNPVTKTSISLTPFQRIPCSKITHMFYISLLISQIEIPFLSALTSLVGKLYDSTKSKTKNPFSITFSWTVCIFGSYLSSRISNCRTVFGIGNSNYNSHPSQHPKIFLFFHLFPPPLLNSRKMHSYFLFSLQCLDIKGKNGGWAGSLGLKVLLNWMTSLDR